MDNFYRLSTVSETKDSFGNTTDSGGNIFIHELSPPFERLVFQFIPDLNWQRTGNWVNIPTPGRNNSYHQLTGGEDNLTFRLDFNSMFEDNKEMCIEKFAWLKSLTINDGQNGSRKVKLVWGDSDLFRFKTWIVKKVGGSMSMFHRNYGMNPLQLYVDIEMEMDPDKNPTLSDTRLRGSGIYGGNRTDSPIIRQPNNFA